MTNEDLIKLTVPALRKLAAERNVKGRSAMAKPALIEALSVIDVDKGSGTGAPIGIVNDPAIDVVVDTNLYATSIGNADHFRDVATVLERQTFLADCDAWEGKSRLIISEIVAFQARAENRYLRDGRKRLTPKQARRVDHKVNRFMTKAGL